MFPNNHPNRAQASPSSAGVQVNVPRTASHGCISRLDIIKGVCEQAIDDGIIYLTAIAGHVSRVADIFILFLGNNAIIKEALQSGSKPLTDTVIIILPLDCLSGLVIV